MSYYTNADAYGASHGGHGWIRKTPHQWEAVDLLPKTRRAGMEPMGIQPETYHLARFTCTVCGAHLTLTITDQTALHGLEQRVQEDQELAYIKPVVPDGPF